MKNKPIILLVSGVIILLAGYLLGSYAPVTELSSVKLKTDSDSFAYAYGLDMGNFVSENIKQFKLEDSFSARLFFRAANTGYYGKKSAIEDFEAGGIIQSFIMNKNQNMEAEMQEQGAENLEKANAFLELNKTKEGIISTQSGLQYRIIEEGNGSVPGETDKVVVHYKGTLTDGTQFDSSIDRGEPATFEVNMVIKGWTEVLQLMKEGSKYQVFIPPSLGYGARSAGDMIPPNSVLIFDMELIEVIK
jgi:FKBP-type peptidyl-prolyl cis-trans isomerase